MSWTELFARGVPAGSIVGYSEDACVYRGILEKLERRGSFAVFTLQMCEVLHPARTLASSDAVWGKAPPSALRCQINVELQQLAHVGDDYIAIPTGFGRFVVHPQIKKAEVWEDLSKLLRIS